MNDMDLELVTFWRVVQNHLEEFLRYYKWAVVSRHLFELANKQDPHLMTDIQRAVRYYYLQRLGFGGRTERRTFGTSALGDVRLNIETINDVLLETHWRLRKVVIEHSDAIKCIQRYDRKSTLFYIDPPYHAVAQAYANKYGPADFVRLRDTLAAISGRFLLSLNDHPQVRDWFAAFQIRRVELRYSAGNSRACSDTRTKVRGELLITNFRPPAAGRQ